MIAPSQNRGGALCDINVTIASSLLDGSLSDVEIRFSETKDIFYMAEYVVAG